MKRLINIIFVLLILLISISCSNPFKKVESIRISYLGYISNGEIKSIEESVYSKEQFYLFSSTDSDFIKIKVKFPTDKNGWKRYFLMIPKNNVVIIRTKLEDFK